MTKRKTILPISIALLLLAAGTALAGYKPPDAPLMFYEQNGAGVALGSMAGVRAGGNATDDIGCWFQADLPNGDTSGGCRVVSGIITRSCTFDSHENEWYALAVSSMTSHSGVVFAWNAQGTCTYLQINNDSAYAPPSVN